MKQNKKTIFETKERETEDVRSRFYVIAEIYWTAVPLLFFFLLVSQTQTGGGAEAVISNNPALLIEMLAQFSNIILAGLLYMLKPSERRKAGLAGWVFKIAIGQQFLIGNFVGALLAFLANRELPVHAPEEAAENEKKFIGRTGVFVLLGLLVVLSLIVRYGRWQL